MEYLLFVLTCYLGLACGTIISYFSQQELSGGKKYFQAILPIIFSLSVLFYMLEINLSVWIGIGACLVSYFVSSRIGEVQYLLTYALFAIMSYEAKELGPIIGVLIFAYGIVYASLKFESIEENLLGKLQKVMLSNIIYPLLAIALYFLRK